MSSLDAYSLPHENSLQLHRIEALVFNLHFILVGCGWQHTPNNFNQQSPRDHDVSVPRVPEPHVQEDAKRCDGLSSSQLRRQRSARTRRQLWKSASQCSDAKLKDDSAAHEDGLPAQVTKPPGLDDYESIETSAARFEPLPPQSSIVLTTNDQHNDEKIGARQKDLCPSSTHQGVDVKFVSSLRDRTDLNKSEVVINLHLNRTVDLETFGPNIDSMGKYFDVKLPKLTKFFKEKFGLPINSWEDFVECVTSEVTKNPFWSKGQFTLTAVLVEIKKQLSTPVITNDRDKERTDKLVSPRKNKLKKR